MSAKDYQLVVSALGGVPYITKKPKKERGVMLDDRIRVPESNFIGAIIAWARGKRMKEIVLTEDGKEIATINFS
jgi:hypothetical protein